MNGDNLRVNKKRDSDTILSAGLDVKPCNVDAFEKLSDEKESLNRELEMTPIKRKKGNYPRKQSRGPSAIKVKPCIPKNREEVLKWNGWGYKEVEFELPDDVVQLSGNRYPQCPSKFPFFIDYFNSKIGAMLTHGLLVTRESMPEENESLKSILKEEYIEAVKDLGIDISTEWKVRFNHCHDQANEAILAARSNSFKRLPDAVAWPTCHEEVVELVRFASDNNIVIVPFGGGTAVTGAAGCPENEERPIIVLSTTLMNEILWVDKESLIVCAESGIVGQDLDRELLKIGFTVGHEPDSKEFSTLGGWVSTRASGMKKNKYGNIEDIVLNAKLVTPSGVLEKWSNAPRMSTGPDFNHLILGSEGNLGVITEVCLKIHRAPEVTLYGSLLFPNFESGVSFLKESARKGLHPSSLRFMDNEHFQLGMAVRGGVSKYHKFIEELKKSIVRNLKGYSFDQVCMATLLYEGDKETVTNQQRKINALAKSYGGLPAGAENGRRGYNLTFIIGYIRDLAFDVNVLVDSMEVSIPWNNVIELSKRIRTQLLLECSKLGVYRVLVMFRIAQSYGTGCCLYIYYSLPCPHNVNMMEMIKRLHGIAKQESINLKGSMSHHHGVGKTRRRWYEKSVSTIGKHLLQSVKAGVDPKNIFAVGNQVYDWKPSLNSKL